MLRLGPRSSCTESLKKLDILTVPCLYIYALMFRQKEGRTDRHDEAKSRVSQFRESA